MPVLRSILPLCLVLGASASISCVRMGFEQEPPQQPDAVVDVGATLDGDHADRGVVANDLAVGDGPTPIVTQDSTTSPPGTLTCSPPQLVGTNSPTYLSEAAMRVDRLELVARDKSGVGYSTKRTSPNLPFGSWTSSSLLAGGADPTFFIVANSKYAVVASTTSPRHLDLCKLGTTPCLTVSIVHKASGMKVTEDMDGPSVAVLPGSGLLMAHNLETSNGETEVYLAQTSDTASPHQGWVTEPVPAVNQTGVKEDDPALSPDGLVLVYNQPDSGNMGELWVSERASTSDAFLQPRLLTDVNSTAVEGSAHLAPKNTTAGKKATYELYFSSNRDTGNYVVYRSICNR